MGLLGVFLVIITWYIHFATDIQYSIIIAIVITLTLVKVSQVLVNYQKFREFAVRVTTKNTSVLTTMNIATAIVGVGLVLLGIRVY